MYSSVGSGTILPRVHSVKTPGANTMRNTVTMTVDTNEIVIALRFNRLSPDASDDANIDVNSGNTTLFSCPRIWRGSRNKVRDTENNATAPVPNSATSSTDPWSHTIWLSGNNKNSR